MILLTPKFEEEVNDLDENNTIDITIRRKYRSFSQIMNSVKHNLLKYYLHPILMHLFYFIRR